MNHIRGVVLAAGKSTRFGTYFNKLLTPLCGMPLVTHTTQLLQSKYISTTVVVGHLKEQVTAAISAHNPHASFVVQEEPLGTGHALLCSRAFWDHDHILVLNGDMPLITADLVDTLISNHTATNAAVSFVAAYPDTLQHTYGRVIITEQHTRIIENKDFTGDRTHNYPINAGIYIFKRIFLEAYADQLQPNNAQNQLYVTDLIGIASAQQLGVTTIIHDYATVHGVNTLQEFTIATQIMRERIINHWLASGVLIEDPVTTWIDAQATIGEGSSIGSGVQLRGTTTVGIRTTIKPYCVIENCTIHDMVTIYSHSVLNNSTVLPHTVVGPFAQLQYDTPINQQKTATSAYQL